MTRPATSKNRSPPRRRARAARDFDQAPYVVIWETTQACDLACRHCRAEAVPYRHPAELSTDEAKRMLDAIRRFGPVVFVFSGGDALKRPDIVELVEHAARLGLRVAMTPAATPLATPEMVARLKAAGLARLAVSLDGSTPAIHDEFRRVPGSFERAVAILRDAQAIGLSTQVNTAIGRHNVADIDGLCTLMAGLGIVFWEVFFLVPVGRARPEDVASAEEFEAIFHKLYDLSRTAPFDIKATAAPHYARVVLQRKVAERRDGRRGAVPDPLTGGVAFSMQDGIGRARSVNDGDGFLFIGHTGEIMPSGFLPVSAGNVRSADLAQVYRQAPLFRVLRDRSLLKGKCGVCEYLDVCGGSRARAWAVTGDPLEAEPFCAHVPARYRRMVERGEAEPVEEYFRRRIRGSGALPVFQQAPG
ncbi:MAG: TIGR04053 family radical SAM/SPASM domain-containing protein [Gemmatimonadetes bacterium]|nr:TIGR04053 family radical SAM/SPASM domain-containing protein [Gemmatimonadota bacterium]